MPVGYICGHGFENLAKRNVDARFEVLSSPFSLLSASISASQNLYTRKGTLVGFNGKPENVQIIYTQYMRLSLIVLPGCFYSFPPRAFSASIVRHSFHLPAHNLHDSLYGFNFYKIRDYLHGHRAP